MFAASGDLERKPPSGSAVTALGEQVVREGKGNMADSLTASDRHRSVYLPVLRNALPEVLDLFDAPDPSLLVGSRDRTNVPAQSLYLMNSAFVVEQSRQFASRLLAGRDASEKGRIERLFDRILGRAPTPEEQQRVAQFEQDKTLWLVTDKRPSKTLTSLIKPSRILQIDVIDRWGSKGIKTEKPLARWEM